MMSLLMKTMWLEGVAPQAGIEPTTRGLTVRCSTD
jgi:hypothetical protein